MKYLLVSFFSFLILSSLSGQDTFSICAVDTVTGEVGSAGASCIDENGIPGGVIVLSDVHPGVGVIHTQAYWNPANQNYARQLMDDSLSPQQIIDSLIANDVQNNPTIRQYGIVDFRDGVARSAAYTGVNTDDYKGHITGGFYSIQGNILLGPQILDSMESRFLNTEGSLVCRLMAALQGAKVPGADIRCLDDGVSSLSAFVRVAKPDDPTDSLSFEFNVPSVIPGVDPIDSLQTLVDQWGGCNATGMGEKIRPDKMDVYPNPANDKITFRLKQDNSSSSGVLHILDAYGKEILRKTVSGKNKIKVNVSGYVSGIYFYKYESAGNNILKGKFVVN
ncbi:MAG: DUF1028 domain-containing protein [Chlorobi bacterium]|nr:DUF1028 domain-containing protein [Chlorobiota bacterium]